MTKQLVNLKWIEDYGVLSSKWDFRIIAHCLKDQGLLLLKKDKKIVRSRESEHLQENSVWLTWQAIEDMN